MFSLLCFGSSMTQYKQITLNFCYLFLQPNGNRHIKTNSHISGCPSKHLQHCHRKIVIVLQCMTITTSLDFYLLYTLSSLIPSKVADMPRSMCVCVSVFTRCEHVCVSEPSVTHSKTRSYNYSTPQTNAIYDTRLRACVFYHFIIQLERVWVSGRNTTLESRAKHALARYLVHWLSTRVPTNMPCSLANIWSTCVHTHVQAVRTDQR